MRLQLVLLISVVVIMVGFGQNYQLRVRHFTMENGLPNDFVCATMQDRDGFIWIATNYGYARFDGYKMEVFNQGQYPNYQVQIYNNTRSILQDPNGKIWISYFINGISDEVHDKLLEVLDPLTKTVTSFDQAFGDIAPFKMNQISVLLSDPGFGICIITTTGAIYRYDGRFNKIGNVPLPNSVPVFLTAINSNTVWLFDGVKQLLYEIGKDSKIRIAKIPKPIAYICADKLDVLWMFPANSTEVWHKPLGKPIKVIFISDNQVIPSPNIIMCSAVDHKDRLWCVKGHHVFIFNRSGKLLLHTTYQETKEDITNLNYSTQIQIDQAGNVWVSTPNGVYMLSLYQSPFTNYMTDKGIQDIRGIIVDEHNHIYVNQLYLYQIDQGERVVADFQGIGSIKDGNIIWNGCYGNITGVIKYDINKRKATRIEVDSVLASNLGHVCVPYKSKQTGRIWLGGIKMLGYLEKEDTVITSFNNYGAFQELKKKSVNWLYDNKEGLWLATSNGLYLLDESKDLLKAFIAPLANLNISHIHEDKNGVFWLATKGNGLWRWDAKNNTFTAFTQQDGLSNNVVYAVYEDDYGFLWLPSNYGLMRFNKNTHVVNNYLPKDGIPHQEFNYTSHTRTPDGRFFFGGLGGVTSFYPKDFLTNTAQDAPLRITNFKKLHPKDGILYDYTGDLVENGQIILNPGERSFELKVALLTYELPERNNYAYRIEGLQEKWNYLTTNSIWIGELPYGRYVLHLKAQDANKYWSKHELHIPIWVKKPFYLQVWFLALFGVCVAGLFIGVVKWRVAQLEKNQKQLQAEVDRQTAKLQALDEQKSRFFLNIAHELRTPLTLISSPVELLLENDRFEPKNKVFLQSIRKNAQHLLRLIESILDLARLDSKQLELSEQPVLLHPLVQGIFSMYESYTKLHGIEYQLNYNANYQLQLLLDIPKFEKILHNLLANAVKFTANRGAVTLEVQETATEMHLQVKDTGVGIPTPDLPYIFDRYFQVKSNGLERGGIGMGLNIAKEYAQLMQGSLTVKSTPNEGSVFYFSFPKKAVEASVILTKEDSPTEVIWNAPAKNTKRKLHTLLIVEDNVEMHELLRQIMAPSYHILQAANGKEALKILEKEEVHGIITDIMMPQMDGLELVEKIKSSSQWQHLPLVVITARSNETERLQALRIGVDDYLYKPFSPQELEARVTNLLSNYQRRIDFQIENKEPLPDVDQQWLVELENQTLELLKQNPNFVSGDIASKMYISEGHLRRKIRSITGFSANDYFTEVRLQRARQLLEQKAMSNVSKVAYTVGFSTPRYFTQLFTARFGKKPSSYLRSTYDNA